MTRYYESTLSKIRQRKASVNRKFESIKLKVDTRWVDLPTFRMIRGVDFHYDMGGIILDKRFEFVVLWSVGKKPKEVTLVGEAGDYFNGSDIPKLFHNLVGNSLDPRFLLASVAHDIATVSGLGHWIESKLFYELLKYQKGQFDIHWFKEKLMYRAVYMWSLLT